MCRAALSPPGPEGLLRCPGTACGGSDEHAGPFNAGDSALGAGLDGH